MHHYAYPATMAFETSGVTVSFDGLPGATWGNTPEEALTRAKDLLATAIEMLREDGEVPPPPGPANGRPIIETYLD